MTISTLPWAIPALPSYLSINWMLNGQWGLINNIIWDLFQVDGPPWLDSPDLALGAVIYGHIWKWLPFWTLIFLAGRLAIPRELYEAADVDGALDDIREALGRNDGSHAASLFHTLRHFLSTHSLVA